MLKTVSTANGLVSPTFSGNVTLTNGNLIIGTSGKGIDFSATPGTGTSELFNDYEEGTWTPSITFQTPGNLSVTYDAQVGTYTKIGNRVILQGYLLTSAFTHTTASGAALINGIPFNASSTSGVVNVSTLQFRGITKVGYNQFTISLESALTTSIVLYASNSGTFTDAVTATDMLTAGTVNLRFTLTYQV